MITLRAALALAFSCWCGVALAQPAGGDSMETRLARAAAAEQSFHFEDARREYAAIVGVDGGAVPRLARRRLAYLDAHSESAFAPLVALERFRRAPLSGTDIERLAAFEQDVADFPRGRCRIEANEALARAYLMLGSVDRAEHVARRALELPEATDADRDASRETLASVLTRAGRSDEALRSVEALVTPDPGREASLRSDARRAVWVPVAIAWLGGFVTITLMVVIRARARVLRGLRFSTILVGALGLLPLAIASSYDDETTDTFASLALVTFLAIALGSLLGAGLGAASAPLHLRRLAAIASAISVVAASYVVLATSHAVVSFLP